MFLWFGIDSSPPTPTSSFHLTPSLHFMGYAVPFGITFSSSETQIVNGRSQMRPSEQKRLQDEIAERLRIGQELLDATEASSPAPTSVSKTSETSPPPEGPSQPSEVWNSISKAHAVRGIRPGGRRRVVTPWMRPLARLMADNTTLQQAARKLGLVFSKKDRERLNGMREFETLKRCYKRLWQTECWGKPMEAQALEKLILREEGRPRDGRKSRAARYISHPRLTRENIMP